MHDEISPSAIDHGEELRAVRAEVDKIVAVMNAKPKSYAKVAATQLTRPKRKPALKRQSRPKETPSTNRETILLPRPLMKVVASPSMYRDKRK